MTARLPFERRDIGLVPGILMLALFGAWAADGGAFRTTAWYPGGLLVFGALAATVVAIGRKLSLPARAAIPLLALTAFTAWSYVSILWAGVPASAWDGANRTAVYLAVFALFSLFEWRPLAAGVWLALFVLMVVVVATVDFVAAVRAGHPGGHFIAGRLSGPIEYPNGSACLFLMAAWPAVLLGSQRLVPWPIRAVSVATAAYLTELALLTESRGAVFSAVVTSVVFLIVVPTRVRAVLSALAVGLAVVLASDPLLQVYQVVIAHGDTHSALVRAANAVLWSCAGLLVAALAVSFAESRWRMGARRARAANRVAGLVLAVAGAAVLAVSVATLHGRVHQAWRHFTAIPKPYGEGLGNRSSHFEADPLSGNRYDVWRVALRQFTRAPAQGAGADNFAVDYLRERRSDEEPQYPFSIELRALGQTGLVGGVLLAVFLVACAATLIRPRRADARAVLVAGATLVAAQWLAHGSVDIFWELPALAAPAFAAFGIGISTAPASAASERPLLPRRRGATLLLAGTLLISVGALTTSFVFPWLAAADVRSAEGTWRSDAGGADAKLRRARSLNPLSDESDVVAGSIASRRHQWAAMRSAFGRATQRNPVNWYSWFELAVVDAYTHRRAAALRELARARSLNPREWTIGFVRYRLGAGRPLPPAQLDRVFRIRYEARNAPAPPRRP